MGTANLDSGEIAKGPLGRVAGSKPRTGGHEIPKTIHRVWIGGAEPEWLKPLGESWCRPDWDLWQWGDEEVAQLFPLRNQSIFDDAPKISPHSFGRLRADLLRYEILHRFGGVYVDVDFECLRPIDELLTGIDCFAAWEVPGVWIGNAILGATTGHPFIDGLVENLPESFRQHRGAPPNVVSGPQYLTRMWQERGGDVEIFDKDLFYPYLWNELQRGGETFARAYAVHHWQQSRRRQNVPLATTNPRS